MHVRHLRVVNIRNHSDLSIELSPKVTLIYGKNGSGKTSLIEAIYLGLRGTSFRDNDISIVNINTDWYRIKLETDNSQDRLITFDNRHAKKLKTFKIDDKTNRVLLARFKYPVVLFQPDDTRLINGSPSRRRKYLDQVISQYNPNYSVLVRRYERALVQRNKLLKSVHITQDKLFSWDVLISNLGADIVKNRQEYIAYINEKIQTYYQQITKDNTTLRVDYIDSGDKTSQTILNKLHSSFERDRIVGATSAGPHRHDYEVYINNQRASNTASRGEIRTVILALKYVEIDSIKSKTDQLPIVLLDDVFGELDDTRQKQLLTSLTDSQVIITSTNSHPADVVIKLSID